VKPKAQILPLLHDTKSPYFRRYLVMFAVLLIICQSFVIQAISYTVQNPQTFHKNATHSPSQIIHSATQLAQHLVNAFKNYVESHPYSSPISSTTFTSLLVLYYENTYVQVDFSPTLTTSDTQDHYQNLYHYLFLAKIPHPPQYLG